ncbi:MAG: DNA recombination protein RmuC [Chlamydiales bacterium]|jgi:DNA recombination protein RmuC|nr:DNA recombination protein RmuC [Chlamydiales bacterium]
MNKDLVMILLAITGWGLWLFALMSRKRLEISLALARQKAEEASALDLQLKKREEEILTLLLQQKGFEGRQQAMEIAEQHFKLLFQSLSSQALEHNNKQFLSIAEAEVAKWRISAQSDLDKRKQSMEEMLIPFKETLLKLDLEIRKYENERKCEREVFKEQVRALTDSEKQLKAETANLVQVLSNPQSRGRWGEMQLKRIIELAGMLNYCDFYEQKYKSKEETSIRPDLLVRLPSGKQIIIDAKVPLEAYLEAMYNPDEKIKKAKFREHARHVRAHVTALSKKSYWEHFQPAPEFVILFLPAEAFFSAALEHDPSLIEVGAEQGVIIATPTTLIALLRTVFYGWRQENLSKQSEKVRELGQELYKRLLDMTGHWSKMGKSLAQAVESYNKAVGSLETRVLVTARKFKDLQLLSEEVDLELLAEIDKKPRDLQIAEVMNTLSNKDLRSRTKT